MIPIGVIPDVSFLSKIFKKEKAQTEPAEKPDSQGDISTDSIVKTLNELREDHGLDALTYATKHEFQRRIIGVRLNDAMESIRGKRFTSKGELLYEVRNFQPRHVPENIWEQEIMKRCMGEVTETKVQIQKKEAEWVRELRELE